MLVFLSGLVIDVDLRSHENNLAHRTREIDRERLIVRRGHPFSITVQCSEPLPPKHHLELVLHLGEYRRSRDLFPQIITELNIDYSSIQIPSNHKLCNLEAAVYPEDWSIIFSSNTTLLLLQYLELFLPIEAILCDKLRQKSHVKIKTIISEE